MNGHRKMLGLGALALCLSWGCASSEDDGGHAGDAGGDGLSNCTDEGCGASVAPLVMLLVDTSGSMERVPGCTCTTASCTECLPDCTAGAPAKNRWAHVLEALTGSYESFACEALERTEENATYDVGYAIPHYAPIGSQQDDGLLDELAAEVRFGIATFDPMEAYGGTVQEPFDDFDFALSNSEAGMWSYPGAAGVITRPDDSVRGYYEYPNDSRELMMDTGIRSADANDGALVVAVDRSTAEARAAEAQRALLKTRPYGGSPTAAALDDLHWLFAEDPALDEERANPLRERHVVLITDGRPDGDFRDVSCEELTCPYPLADEAARALRCGYGEGCDDGVVTRVHVVAFDTDPMSVEALDAVASAGGTARAIIVDDADSLKAALNEIVEDAR